MNEKLKYSLKKIKILRYVVHFPLDIKIIIKYRLRLLELEKENIQYGTSFLKFKNRYKGKRCFIIGLGPSLRVEDLDLLENEICFASNRIYQLFDKTKWRPEFYCTGDPNFSVIVKDELPTIVKQCKYVILGLLHLKNYGEEISKENNVYFYKTIPGTPFDGVRKEYGHYKERVDLTREIDSVGTITYEMIEMAIYMGFSEIYLLGIDNSYVGDKKYTDGISAKSENEAQLLQTTVKTDSWTRGYTNINKIANNRNIKIKNATRGGFLEVFERVKLEEVIK
ncbi:6-hydroxymethylpterin diphosphokinase MptE-like protein [Pseudobutyrivibrio xylanivorans]|uniref:6-hydroxymethylpterin diphosphokinase MptE-like domain-containing protein n=1 Tax=Pseudobutyrivibrio xylanivorans TaxID=185007 RepID=A0A1G5S4H8_PSEXY|nr:6-hydroxymethylpterin diphosphokinase MptE-like protein [Pseudobutyrivibrio xylanivorans]SCZ81226.1 Protein of unknown function DUF115 [Pseudobutyrivibrio xylanivorans]